MTASDEARPGLDSPTPSTLPEAVTARLAGLARCDLAVGVLTYNNADTVIRLSQTILEGCEKHLAGLGVVLVNADAGSTDGTPELLAGAGLPTVSFHHDAPPRERVSVPFHGIPGRGLGLQQTLEVAARLEARAVVLLEPDLVSMTDDWLRLLARPVLDDRVDLVLPVYARHRYDSTISTLILGPLVRALFGRRLHRPFGGQQGLSARLIDCLLAPSTGGRGRDLTDMVILGAAIAGNLALCEAWLGSRTLRSTTRTTELPALVAGTLGPAFALMDRHADLWLEQRGSERLPAVGEPAPPSGAPMEVDTERMVEAFALGVRDLTSIWELILAPETLADVLSLAGRDARRFAFPDDLWARAVYDFALGHHYNVIHREHLLRSLVPLYLGRTAAFVLATQAGSPEATQTAAEAVGAAFEGQKPYLVERWR